MKRFTFFMIIMLSFVSRFTLVFSTTTDKEEFNKTRMSFYQVYEAKYYLPWYLIAAIDQYERNIKSYRSECPKEDEIISVCFSRDVWTGLTNPNQEDYHPDTIQFFFGLGVDGDGDGRADRLNPHDRLTALLNYITQDGISESALKANLTAYYQSEKSVKIIFTIAKLFAHYQTIELERRVFPIPRFYRVDYTNNYGTGRSYGGYRLHEGIDLFAHYGTPVLSTSYGVIEVMGWNQYGGYRIGIRDIYNTYQYYAHLSGYAKGLEVGSIVEPGQVIGYVGSTGYGKEGTSGKFPPHLHFGLYKYDGKHEWSFNPYGYLQRWERVPLR